MYIKNEHFLGAKQKQLQSLFIIVHQQTKFQYAAKDYGKNLTF